MTMAAIIPINMAMDPSPFAITLSSLSNQIDANLDTLFRIKGWATDIPNCPANSHAYEWYFNLSKTDTPIMMTPSETVNRKPFASSRVPTGADRMILSMGKIEVSRPTLNTSMPNW